MLGLRRGDARATRLALGWLQVVSMCVGAVEGFDDFLPTGGAYGVGVTECECTVLCRLTARKDGHPFLICAFAHFLKSVIVFTP